MFVDTRASPNGELARVRSHCHAKAAAHHEHQAGQSESGYNGAHKAMLNTNRSLFFAVWHTIVIIVLTRQFFGQGSECVPRHLQIVLCLPVPESRPWNYSGEVLGMLYVSALISDIPE